MLTAGGNYEDRVRDDNSRTFALYSPERWHAEHPPVTDADRLALEDEHWRYAGSEE